MLVVRFDKAKFIQAVENRSVAFFEDHLLVENVTVIRSAFDAAMESAATATAATIGAVQTGFMLISLPQAFILMKILQTLDYYVYLDCKHPSNFAQFLQMMTNNLLNYLPNAFEWLEDDEGEPIYERFAASGVQVHIFANLGQLFTLLLIILGIKLVLFLLGKLLGKYVKKMNKIHRIIGVEMIFGLMESFHMDSVLSVLVFIGQRDRVNSKSSLSRYLVLVFTSFYSLLLVSTYLYMCYTISRLTNSYFEHIIIDVKDFKNEPMKFLLADKDVRGNKFQRHFNLMILTKDLFFAVLLYSVYYHPRALIMLLTLVQSTLLVLIFAYPPYNTPRLNSSVKITQTLYLLLNLWFMVLIFGGDDISESVRYYIIGFSMICNVLLVLVCNIAYSIFDTIQEWKRKRAKNQRKLEREKQKMNKVSNSNESMVSRPEEGSSKNEILPGKDESSLNQIETKQNKKGEKKEIGSEQIEELDEKNKKDAQEKGLKNAKVDSKNIPTSNRGNIQLNSVKALAHGNKLNSIHVDSGLIQKKQIGLVKTGSKTRGMKSEVEKEDVYDI